MKLKEFFISKKGGNGQIIWLIFTWPGLAQGDLDLGLALALYGYLPIPLPYWYNKKTAGNMF